MPPQAAPHPTAWHLNPDAGAAPWSPWADYTRIAPPTGPGGTHLSTERAMAMTNNQMLTVSAHHEAGHAVTWSYYGLTVGPVTYYGPDGMALASSTLETRSGPWEGFAVGFAAGHRAGIEWMRRTDLLTPGREWAAERQSAGDREGADTVIQQCFSVPLTYGASNEHTDWSWMCDRADEILTEQWEAVERLATALVSQWSRGEPVMTADTVKHLIEEF